MYQTTTYVYVNIHVNNSSICNWVELLPHGRKPSPYGNRTDSCPSIWMMLVCCMHMGDRVISLVAEMLLHACPFSKMHHNGNTVQRETLSGLVSSLRISNYSRLHILLPTFFCPGIEVEVLFYAFDTYGNVVPVCPSRAN
jgi:hypothetical protein